MNKKKLNIGKITQKQILTSERKISREIELENQAGWVSKHKVHKSKKTYTRKPKYGIDY